MVSRVFASFCLKLFWSRNYASLFPYQEKYQSFNLELYRYRVEISNDASLSRNLR